MRVDEDMSKSDVERLYEELISRFTSWAQTQSDVRAAIVVGSRARTRYPADEWADLDITMFTADPERYLSRTDWLENMGKPLLTFVEPTATGNERERRVLFEDMLDVDFAIIPVEWIKNLLEHGIPPEMRAQLLDTVERGMRVLLDKDKVIDRMNALFSTTENPRPHTPTEHEFLEVVNDFLYHAVFTAKHLKRGELWWALTCLDCHMQRLLLEMITWHARTTKGWSYDTWFRGRFLERWADPTVLEGLRETFAQYDEADAKRGLLGIMKLFEAIAEDTSGKLDYSYPVEASSKVTRWIRDRFAE
jgi:aminoglycoside 6-adenylyltransferase